MHGGRRQRHARARARRPRSGCAASTPTGRRSSATTPSSTSSAARCRGAIRNSKPRTLRRAIDGAAQFARPIVRPPSPARPPVRRRHLLGHDRALLQGVGDHGGQRPRRPTARLAARGDEEGTANKAHRVAVYGLMFKMAEALLDPKSPCAVVWTSTLHQTHSWKDEDLYGLLMIYFMTSYYDGVYPYKHDGLSRYAPLGNLELEHEEDRTEDYRQTSIREREHFGWLKYGCTPPAFLTSALTLVTDPHWLIFRVDLARAFFGWESWHIGRRCALRRSPPPPPRPRHHHRDRRHHPTPPPPPHRSRPSPRQTRSTMASIPMRSASSSGRSTSSPPPRSAPPSSDRAA